MSRLRNSFNIYIRCKFHILRMNTQNFKSAFLVRHANIDFTVEAARPTQCWIKLIRSVCRTNYDNFTAAFNTVHECEKLRDDTFLDFAFGFLTVGCD